MKSIILSTIQKTISHNVFYTLLFFHFVNSPKKDTCSDYRYYNTVKIQSRNAPTANNIKNYSSDKSTRYTGYYISNDSHRSILLHYFACYPFYRYFKSLKFKTKLYWRNSKSHIPNKGHIAFDFLRTM